MVSSGSSTTSTRPTSVRLSLESEAKLNPTSLPEGPPKAPKPLVTRRVSARGYLPNIIFGTDFRTAFTCAMDVNLPGIDSTCPRRE